MNRPFVFCHMLTSLDGKITGGYMGTPQGNAAGEVFYDLAFGPKRFYQHQGWRSGRVTTDDNFTFYHKPALDENAPAVLREIIWRSLTSVCSMFRSILMENWAGKAPPCIMGTPRPT